MSCERADLSPLRRRRSTRFREKRAVSVPEKQAEQISRKMRSVSKSIDEGSSKWELQILANHANCKINL